MKNIKFNSIVTTVCFIIFALSSLQVSAQHHREKIREKFKTQQIAFISERLELTEDEAQKFWPIYNAYKDEQQSFRRDKKMRTPDNLTDQEAEEMMDQMQEVKSKELALQNKYIEKMKTAIPPRKIALLFKAESEFKELVVAKIKERRRGNK